MNENAINIEKSKKIAVNCKFKSEYCTPDAI